MSFNFDFLNKNSLNDFEIYVEKIPSNVLPQRNVEFIEVPGRNSSLTQDYKTYKDFVLPVTCWFIDNTDLPSKIDNVKAWLAGGSGDLILSNQPDKKLTARVIDQTDIAEEYQKLGSFQVNFRCKPFKYEVTSSTITITAGGNIANPGTYYSEPIIKLYGSGTIVMNINGNVITLNNVTDYVTINTEIQDCYKDNLLMNDNMIGDFPILQIGINTISWTGTVNKIEITPNWRWL